MLLDCQLSLLSRYQLIRVAAVTKCQLFAAICWKDCLVHLVNVCPIHYFTGCRVAKSYSDISLQCLVASCIHFCVSNWSLISGFICVSREPVSNYLTAHNHIFFLYSVLLVHDTVSNLLFFLSQFGDHMKTFLPYVFVHSLHALKFRLDDLSSLLII